MPIPTDYHAEKQLSAKERAFQQIQEWIIDGTLLPGEKINDLDLAKAINISRTPVREALQMLSLQGFVSMRPGVATYVNESNPDDLCQLLPPLAVLQSLASQLAAGRISRAAIRELRVINAEFSAALQRQDYYTALKRDEQLHQLIVDVCENTYLTSITRMLQAHVRRLFFQKAIILTAASAAEHEQLIDALSNADADAAAQIARENWMRPVAEYLETQSHPKEDKL